MNPRHTTVQERIIIIDIDGVLNNETARALDSNVDALLAQDKKILILNGKNLSFVTSRGISILLSCIHRIMEQGGKAALVELNREVESLFSVLQISKFLNIYPTKQDAIDSFKQSFFPSGQNELPAEQDIFEDNNSPELMLEEKDGAEFDSPLIVECSTCGSLVRVYRAGEYICPGCKTQFSVSMDGTAVF